MGDVHRAVAELGDALESHAEADRAEHEAAYLKSALRHLGVRLPVIRSATRKAMRDNGIAEREAVVRFAEVLWGEPVHEWRMAAVEALRYRVAVLLCDDLRPIERMLRESGTWALVDALASDVVGAIVSEDPASADVLDRWAGDDDFWIRRSALLALLLPLRSGHGDWARFSRYADSMLHEREFFIRKAIGWVLRETAKRRPELVETWLRERPGRVAVLAVREAVKPLPERVRDELIVAARRAR